MKVITIVLAVLLLLPLLSSSMHAQEVLILNPSIRSQGLGRTGAADNRDPANAYLNPATIFSLRGVFITGGYGKLIPELAGDIRTYNFGLAGGYSIGLGEVTRLGLAGCFRYNKLDYGSFDVRSIYNPSQILYTYEAYERYCSMVLSCGLIAEERHLFGIGFSVKPLKSDLAPDREKTATAYDFGVFFRSTIGLGNGFTLSPSIGYSYLNLGDDIEYETALISELPDQRRFGVGLQIATHSIDSIDELLGRKTPLLTLLGNVEMIKEHVKDKSSMYGFGLELGIVQALFLRLGYFDHEDAPIEDFTYGIGIGVAYRWFQFRFDYANVPQAKGFDNINKFGGTAGVLF